MRPFFGPIKTQQRYKGGFARLGIFVQAFASQFGITRHIQYIISNLERQTNGIGIACQRCGILARHYRTGPRAIGYQCAGFTLLQVRDLIQCQRCVRRFRRNVQGLPQNHALRARCTCQFHRQRGAHRCIITGLRRKCQFKAQGLQCIARQHGRRIIPFFVNRWPPATHIVIIHAGQVIMNQGIGMDRLNPRCGPDGLHGGNVKQARAFHNQKRAQTFAAL